jgi:hypothetical protein
MKLAKPAFIYGLLALSTTSAIAQPTNKAERQAVEAITQMDGKVELDTKKAGRPAYSVSLLQKGADFTDADLEPLAALKQLQILSCYFPFFSTLSTLGTVPFPW